MTERELFAEALHRPAGEARVAFVAEACGADAALRARVERLLAVHAGPAAVLDRPPGDWLAALAERTGTAADAAAATADQLTPFLAPPTRPDALGRLGRYDVLSVLGVGGFGVVVKAVDDALQRVVAVKVLAPHLAATSPPRKRFLREACAAAKVKHEGVVQIHSTEAEPIPHLVMEFVEGPTLQQMLDRDGPFTAEEVVRVGCQVALGLAAAHDQGLIHRDVKPANILLEAGGERRAKLTDFGLARAVDDASLTQSGTIAGSPLYMSPEQAKGESLDHRTDLFSLGSTLYAIAAGRPPFRAPETLAILKRVAEDRPRPIREVIADVPEGLCTVIERLLEKDPADRFPTARATAEALGRCLTDPVPALAKRKPQSVDVSRRRLAAGLAAALAVVAGVAVFARPWAPARIDAPPTTAAADGDRERKVAEAMLMAGGSVYVNGDDREITAEADLPPDRFTLTRVNLNNHKRVDAVLPRLRGLTGLTRLDLSFSSLSDASLVHVADCTGLRCLHMHNTGVTDAGLAHLKRLSRLEEIAGNFMKLTDNGLALLVEQHPALANISFTNTVIGDAGLEHLKRLKGLRKLYVGGTQLTDVGMAHIAHHTDLVLLDLWGALITADGVAHLKGLRKLEWLRLRNVPIGDAGIAHLHGCTALKYLGVQEVTHVTAAAVAAFHAAVPGCQIEHNGPTINPAP